MFTGFESHDVVVGEQTIHARVGGWGPPLLLLHGYPQTHVMWHGLAQALAESHTVVVADLRGYGDSSKPPNDETHAAYSKRAMAADQVGLMRALGHERFALVGHDRGARVAHRLCLDHPDAVTRTAVLDIVPTRHVFRHVDRALATFYWHWFFLAQPGDLPEQMIGGDPEGFLRGRLLAWSHRPEGFTDEAVDEYVRCFADPAAVHASCEDYRAGAGIDLEHDDEDAAAGRRVGCPLLVLWGSQGFVGAAYDVLEVWREYADDVRGTGMESGHFLPEEAPEETLRELETFLAEVSGS